MEILTRIVLGVTILALIIATLYDIRHHKVKNWLTYSTFLTTFTLIIIQAITEQSWQPLQWTGYALAISFIAGIALSKLGFWGPGDSKLLIALSPVIGSKMFGFTLINIGIAALLMGAHQIWHKLFRKEKTETPLALSHLLAYLLLILGAPIF